MDKKIEQIIDTVLKQYADKVGKQGVQKLKDSFSTGVRSGFLVPEKKFNFNAATTTRTGPFRRSAEGETPPIDTGKMFNSNSYKVLKDYGGKYGVQLENTQPYAYQFDGKEHRRYFQNKIQGTRNWYTIRRREYFQPVVRTLQAEVNKFTTTDNLVKVILEVLGG